MDRGADLSRGVVGEEFAGAEYCEELLLDEHDIV